MLKSMTGYGRSQQVIHGRDITVEVKAVNHRFFEFSCKMPRAYLYLEDKLKGLAQQSISRGKVDISLTIIAVGGANINVEINHELAAEYVKALRELGKSEGLTDDLSLTAMTRFSDIFTVRKIAEDEEQLWLDIQQVAVEAVSEFVHMREAEGMKLKEDISMRLLNIENSVEKIVKKSPSTVEAYRKKLYDKIADLLQDRNVDEHRILSEAAVFAEKIAVDEETVRLHSHINQARQFLEMGEPVGRKLDFLVQEFNREANTIGSKAQDIEISRIVVDVKAEIEKIREQVQNIE